MRFWERWFVLELILHGFGLRARSVAFCDSFKTYRLFFMSCVITHYDRELRCTPISDLRNFLFILGVVLALSSLIGFAEATVGLLDGSRLWPA